MAVCPRCGAELNGEFGMTQCPSCSGFSFIGDDGIARAPEEEIPALEIPVGVPTPETAADHEGFVAVEESSPRIETPEITEEPPFAFDPVPSAIIDIPQSPEGFGSEMASDFGMDAFAPAEEPAAWMPEPVREQPREDMAFGPASDPLNLNEFANSEVSSGRDGPLLFRVILKGIDTKEIREIIREVLNDDRFRLDSAAIMARVSKGNLVIDGLSPVKASILVTRIKKLPVTIRWEQYAITEANP